MLLDPAKLDPSGLTTVAWFSPIAGRQAGRLRHLPRRRREHDAAPAGGRHRRAAAARDPRTGSRRPTGCPMAPASSTATSPNPNDPYSGQVCFHRLGTAAARTSGAPPAVHAGGGREARHDLGPSGTLSRDGRWLLLGYCDQHPQQRPLGGRLRAVPAPPASSRRRRSRSAVEAQLTGRGRRRHALRAHPAARRTAGSIAVDLRDRPRRLASRSCPSAPTPSIQDVAVARGVLAVEYLRERRERDRAVRPRRQAGSASSSCPASASAALAAEDDRDRGVPLPSPASTTRPPSSASTSRSRRPSPSSGSAPRCRSIRRPSR